MAARPKTLTAAFVPVLCATALARQAAPGLELWIPCFALLSALFIQIATNLFNDAFDFLHGTDQHDRLGPTRAAQSGLLSARAILAGALICSLLALALGIPLVIKGGLPIVIIGLVSLFFAYGYTSGPYPLSYLGLGDLFVLIFFGWVAVGGVFYLLLETIRIDTFVLGTQIGLLATVLIAINNLRDLEQDRRANKFTLAVRLGERASKYEILLLIFLPYLLSLYWWFHGNKLACLLSMASLPFAWVLARNIYRFPPSAIYNVFLAQAALVHLIFGVALALGFLFG